MQIYTKILIGMSVGAAIGVFLGPKSVFLERDLYRVDRAEQVTLQTDPDDPESALAVPAKARLRLKVLETRAVPVTTRAGDTVELPARVRVRFKYTQQLALLDRDGVLARTLGVARVGDPAEAWLVRRPVETDDGGFVLLPEPVSSLGDTVVRWISPVGDVFMRLIQMVIVPLVFASLLVGVASLGDVRKLGRLGTRTLILYFFTTAAAVTIGLTIANLAKPGSFVAAGDQAALRAEFDADAGSRVEAAADAPSAIDNILNIIPVNPIASLSNVDPAGRQVLGSASMLQIIFFALIFGIALTLLKPKRARRVVRFFDAVQHAMIIIIHMVMAVAPYGVAALLAVVIGQSGISILGSLFAYGLVVIVGLLLHATLVYGGLVMVFTRLKLPRFLKAARPAQLIAFSTSSSSATLPITMECAENNLGVSRSVTSFVVPLGSTVNMDGTALYQGVAAVFIAQVFDVGLSLGAQVGIVFAATAASIGAAGVPGAGMITLAMVLTAAGIPIEGVALILGVDRILDMFRTAVNVTGDLAVTSVMAVSEGETLHTLSKEEDRSDPERGFEGRLAREPHPVRADGEPDAEPGGEDD